MVGPEVGDRPSQGAQEREYLLGVVSVTGYFFQQRGITEREKADNSLTAVLEREQGPSGSQATSPGPQASVDHTGTFA